MFDIDYVNEPATPAPPRRAGWKRWIVAAFVASVVAGGAIGVTLTDSTVARAQTPSEEPYTTTPAPPQPGPDGPRGGRHGMFDVSVAAGAIGISESDLRSALSSGQSMADVARANNVDPQKVIDALVADETSKIDARVASGEITQAQADAKKANLSQRVTDRVNGVRPAHGPGGPRGAGGPCDGPGPMTTTASSSTST